MPIAKNPNGARFLLTPLREGRPRHISSTNVSLLFLLTPLREGRRYGVDQAPGRRAISTHAPARGATSSGKIQGGEIKIFLLTPLREGRLYRVEDDGTKTLDFYSRPCERGDEEQYTALQKMA